MILTKEETNDITSCCEIIVEILGDKVNNPAEDPLYRLAVSALIDVIYDLNGEEENRILDVKFDPRFTN